MNKSLIFIIFSIFLLTACSNSNFTTPINMEDREFNTTQPLPEGKIAFPLQGFIDFCNRNPGHLICD